MSNQPQDPKEKEPTPPFPSQSQPYPGTEENLQPKADHGEHSYKGCAKLTGRAAIITGGDSGIGRAVALAFAREGADVLISYLNEHEDAQETRRLVEEAGRKAVLMAGDVGDEAHCQAIVERAKREFGRIDCLVNNAAYQAHFEGGIAEITAEEIDKTFRVNIYAMFYLSKAAIPHMQPGSTIINTTSIQSYDPSPSLLPYATTKGAVTTFTRALAKDAIEKGIRVNAVAPGPIWTPLITSTFPPDKPQDFGKNTPIGRAGQPYELAPMFVFLAAEDSSYITGEVFPVTGGRVTA